MPENSVLVEYLDRRRTQPVGVVNPRKLQLRFLRVSDAIAQRFALLNQLKTRYGTSEEQLFSDSELTLVTASQTNSETQSNTLAEVAQSIADLPKSTINEVKSQPTETFRVSRKLTPPPSASNSLKLPEKNVEIIKENSVNSTKVLETIIREDSGQAIAPTPDLILSKTTTSEVKNIHFDSIKSHITEVINHSHLPISQAIVNKSTSLSTAKLPASLPLVKAESTALIEQKEKLVTITEKEQSLLVVNQVVRSESVITRSLGGKAIAPEIPISSSTLPQPKMVLRKSNDVISTTEQNSIFTSPLKTNSISPNTEFPVNNLPINKLDNNNFSSDSAIADPVQTSPVNPEINVTHIAEEVSRILSRRLTVERERRGLN